MSSEKNGSPKKKEQNKLANSNVKKTPNESIKNSSNKKNNNKVNLNNINNNKNNNSSKTSQNKSNNKVNNDKINQNSLNNKKNNDINQNKPNNNPNKQKKPNNDKKENNAKVNLNNLSNNNINAVEPNKVIEVSNKSDSKVTASAKLKDTLNDTTKDLSKDLLEDTKNLSKDLSKELTKEDLKLEIMSKDRKPSYIYIIFAIIFFLLALLLFGYIYHLNNFSYFKDVTIEFGQQEVTLKDFLRSNVQEEDCTLITDLNTIDFSKVGNYQVQIACKEVVETVNLTIQDTTPPTLELQDVSIYLGENVDKNNFIKEVNDLSLEVTTNLITEINFDQEGQQEVEIEAYDIYQNKVVKKATLTISKDKEAPKITGLTDLTVKKNAKINYTSGVKAVDSKDGEVAFTYDASKVDVTKSGSYYATYTATDNSGNKATAKRKITVDHDENDTAALVASIASTLSDDPEELRDYCRNKIKYDHNDGGDDPLYYGLTKWKGNCYVHAMCFQALLNAKGIENQLIWVTNKTHYWNLVKINGVWRHMDSTPDRNHRKISIMTDEQRLSTLSGRKWDFSAWPAAN